MDSNSIIISDFLLSAGAILIDEEKKQVCLLKHEKSKEYLLPKGRKELDETIAEAAQREVFEETGHKNKIEPEKLLGIYFRHHIGGTPGQHKVIYWFYSKLASKTRIEGTQEAHENFAIEWYDLETAKTKLSFDDDKILIQRAFAHLPKNDLNILKTLPQNDLINCGPDNKCIRFLSFVNTKIIKGLLAFDEGNQKVLLSMDRAEKSWKLPTENDGKLADSLMMNLSKNVSASFFQLIFEPENCIIEWYILKMTEDGVEGSKFFPKEKALVEFKNNDNYVDVVETGFKINK